MYKKNPGPFILALFFNPTPTLGLFCTHTSCTFTPYTQLQTDFPPINFCTILQIEPSNHRIDSFATRQDYKTFEF